MNFSYYKYCMVPQCNNTTIKTPDKLFIYVPNKKLIREKWLKLAKRSNAHLLSTSTRMYFCEDHFDLPNDMLNYTEYHIMGKVAQVRMKPGCTPTKFTCQEDGGSRKRKSSSKRLYKKKKQKKMIVECPDNEDFETSSSLKHSEPVRVTSELVPVEFEKYKKNTTQGESVKKNKQDAGSSPSHDSDNPSMSGTNEEKLCHNMGQCRFCGDYTKECIEICHIPYLNTHNTLVFNDISIQLDFRSNLPKTVCSDCNFKLEEMRDFVILVKEAQENFKVETKRKRDEIESKTIRNDNGENGVENNFSKRKYEDIRDDFEDVSLIKVECKSPIDEVYTKRNIQCKVKIECESKGNEANGDALTSEETVFSKKLKRKTIDVDTSKGKKAEFNSLKEFTYDIHIKEEVIENDDKNEDETELGPTEIGATSIALNSVNYNTIDKLTLNNSIQGNRTEETQVKVNNT